jgi:hypothetical protein
MKVRKTRHWVMLMCILGALSSVGLADRRSYVWTYEYQTMPKGAMEVEYYLTHKVSDWNKYDDKNTWDHQVEFEYGLTDHWDVAMYQTWRQTNTEDEDSFDYTGTKLRTRYRIGEKDQLPLDVVLYAEYIFGDGPKEYDKFEGKLILAKDLGKWNIAYNQIYEKKTKNGNDTEHGYATGLSYEFSPVWKMGIESAGNYTEDKYYLGPTASWASEKFWVNLGALRGLNDASNDLQFRLIVGIPF